MIIRISVLKLNVKQFPQHTIKHTAHTHTILKNCMKHYDIIFKSNVFNQIEAYFETTISQIKPLRPSFYKRKIIFTTTNSQIKPLRPNFFKRKIIFTTILHIVYTILFKNG